jgi:hypothetical protein
MIRRTRLCSQLTGQVVEDSPRASEIGEDFFFGAEFEGTGYEAAARATHAMLDVEHFAVEDIFKGDLDRQRLLTGTRFLRQSR